jgi:ornithine lipid ester-linked acyl 2-hydroxylase
MCQDQVEASWEVDVSATADQRRLTIAERTRDMAVTAGQQVMSGFEWWMLRSSRIPTTPFLDRESYAWAGTLEKGWHDIRAELDEVLVRHSDLPNFQDILRDVAPISRDDQWKTYFFFAYGYRIEANCARCPRTIALLDQIPGLVTAFFSILSPHKKIPPHRGPYRGVVRCHLGLMIPDPPDSCGISVGGEVRHWHEGETMFFDDGYEHFAWNDSDETRVVLFLDVVRPLRGAAASVNRALLKGISVSPFLKDARRRHEAWERRFERLAR